PHTIRRVGTLRPRRRPQKSAALVIANGLNAHTASLGETLNVEEFHALTPYHSTEVIVNSRETVLRDEVESRSWQQINRRLPTCTAWSWKSMSVPGDRNPSISSNEKAIASRIIRSRQRRRPTPSWHSTPSRP